MTAGGHVEELGHRSGEGSAGGSAPESKDSDGLITDAVARADLLRSRQAVFGREMPPRTAMFLSRAAKAAEGERAVEGGQAEAATEPRAVQVAELDGPGGE